MSIIIKGDNGVDLTTDGSGNPRITGDFSNATLANRVAFQSSTTGGSTGLAVLPNGTGSTSQHLLFNNSDPTNAGALNLQMSNGDARIASAITGTGTYLPMTFYTGGSERMRIDTSGNLLVTTAAGLGYGTGAGGTVTQATSKATAVTLNRPTGSITMNNAALAAGARVTFACNNSLVTTNDVVVISLSGGSVNPDDYLMRTRVFAGGFTTSVINQGAGSLSEAIVLNFAIIKGANA